ncbi:hypothetical protein V494_05073 [Pseudogymnoascus sp. VKM F-4513 (FW-928)]|nr:hypothetical protein V494_05073 [Pseudogymnoascus sp. VKM F-4513 (FW-928)]
MPSESVEHSAAADMQSQPGPTQTSQHSATRTPRTAWRPADAGLPRTQTGMPLPRFVPAAVGQREHLMPLANPIMLFTACEADRG